MKSHYVEIVEIETGNVERRMGPMSASQADSVEAGAEINLNHDSYFVRVVAGPVSTVDSGIRRSYSQNEASARGKDE